MYFDTEYNYSQETHPDLTPDEIVIMMKEDFLDTILKQWSWEELMETIVVMED
jgi:hypothetical protein